MRFCGRKMIEIITIKLKKKMRKISEVMGEDLGAYKKKGKYMRLPEKRKTENERVDRYW